MPASEQTWRDQKLMHVIFGVSALIMLGSTVWMLERDHNREWRQWQLQDRGKESWALNSQLAEQSAASHSELEQLESALEAAESGAVDVGLVEHFKQIAEAEDRRLAEAGRLPSKANFAALDRAVASLAPMAQSATKARVEIEPKQQAARAALSAKVSASEGDTDDDELRKLERQAKAALYELQQADGARRSAQADAARARSKVVSEMDGIISEAKRREDALTVEKKFVAAEHTAIVSEHGLAIGAGRPPEEIDAIQQKIDELAARMRELDAQVAAAKDYRLALDSIVGEISSEERDLQKQLDAVRGELRRIAENRDKNTWNLGEWITRQPVLDALYDGNVKIEQIWLPDITINYNFSSVARYDRCTTCHRSIDKTAPGSATEPAFPAIPKDQRKRTLHLATPDEEPRIEISAKGEQLAPTLASIYGFVLADKGQVDPYAITIEYVAPETLAAKAGLEMGDVVVEVNGGRVYERREVEEALLRTANWGEPIQLLIRRGLDQPFTSHPRLDLFVGSMSPHKRGEMGCTICHDGQGSATDFKWASHTPNDPGTALKWSRQHGWFDNHHWIFPMTPERFIESNCLKCHHEVVDLEPSERFPDPPAPKLVQGFHLVRQYGCYGCHEIHGYDGPERRIGPDLRLEPNYHEVAAALKNDQNLSDEQYSWAHALVHSSDSDEVRQQLHRSIMRDAESGEDSRLDPTTHVLAELLKDMETPGGLRKVGPSLRHLDAKVEYDWLYSWIRQPSDFRPSTRMPQFFGLHEHLESQRREFPDGDGNENALTDKEYTQQFEAIEIRALAEFLLVKSVPFEYLEPAKGVTEEPSVERGKWLFESRGCLACHSHEEFPGIASDQGPDLSRVAAKFTSEKGRRWLYSWLKQPNRYHAHTVMPNLFLNPIEEVDLSGQPTGAVTDPAADILAFLTGVPADWQPQNVPQGPLTADEEAALRDLVVVWLSASYPRSRAERYARQLIPAEQGANIKGDEAVLVRPANGDTVSNKDLISKQLEYVARRTISRYGCFGCHDIPGYEAVKPIGTALADWGRKEPDKLAFENISSFLATHGVDGTAEHAEGHGNRGNGGHHGLDPLNYGDDVGYFLQSLNSHQRNGFLWQKLRMPRSFDYEKTRNKRYDERLRMPKFPFNAEQREAVMTFVLGLVSEPPATKFVYKPDARAEAIVQGRHVLHKYNCGGCHVLDMERWQLAIAPDWFEEPPVILDFPFMQADFPAADIEASLKTDRRGLLDVSLYGMPDYNQETGRPSVVDEDGVPLEPGDDEYDPFYQFTLYRDTVVAGEPRLVGVQSLLIPTEHGQYGPANGIAYPANGGDLTRYLFGRVIEEEKKTNPAALGAEAWGWLPPPLVAEGNKVQTDWLHGFLMDPHAIRPAVVMRMPNFHMTSDEASKLVNYFAAKDNAEWPYEYNERRRGDYLASKEDSHPELLNDAMKIVTDGNYCVKCHAVGDYQPKGAIKTQGPQLADVYQRLRPSFVRRWIANPKRTLPYTGMPVNIPYSPEPDHFGGVSQGLYPGTSIEQLDGVVDLLMNFDEYSKRQTTIKTMVKEVPAEAEGQATSPPGPRLNQSAEY